MGNSGFSCTDVTVVQPSDNTCEHVNVTLGVSLPLQTHLSMAPPKSTTGTDDLTGELKIRVDLIKWNDKNDKARDCAAVFKFQCDNTSGVSPYSRARLRSQTKTYYVMPITSPQNVILDWLKNEGKLLQIDIEDLSNNVCLASCQVNLVTLDPVTPIIQKLDIRGPAIDSGDNEWAMVDSGTIGTVRLTIELHMYSEADSNSQEHGVLAALIRHIPDSPTTTSPPPGSSLGSSVSSSSSTSSSSKKNEPREWVKQTIQGIRTAAWKQDKATQGLTMNDYRMDGSAEYHIPGKHNCTAKQFCPKVFRRIRQFGGVTTNDYDSEWNLPDSKMSLSAGAGRSGSLFLQSNNKKYILKTVSYKEMVTFLGLLKGYYYYLSKSPNTLIMHIYDCFQFTWGLSSIYLIVFRNLLHSPDLHTPAEAFDLKGREIKNGKAFERRGQQGCVWKDKDLERFFWLPDNKRAKFFNQLEQDVRFLQNHDMMDYSLLIGVRSSAEQHTEKHPPPKTSSISLTPPTPMNKNQATSSTPTTTTTTTTTTTAAAPAPTSDTNSLLTVPNATPVASQQTVMLVGEEPAPVSMFRSEQGGIASAPEAKEVYYIGIIDCLTAYSKRKKIAHFSKTFMWQEKTLSTVPSNMYANRFIPWMQSIFPSEEASRESKLPEKHPNFRFGAKVPLLHPPAEMLLTRSRRASNVAEIPPLATQPEDPTSSQQQSPPEEEHTQDESEAAAASAPAGHSEPIDVTKPDDVFLRTTSHEPSCPMEQVDEAAIYGHSYSSSDSESESEAASPTP
eukprot:TRINITY_DN59136_c0_g1_i1.p1 TRINITY_DN59136_c0_g1~~TRINITY_DN59136_c0_g1_i1.p1  ORF type:complete len:784 (-),score=75.59 TRINITY_DN59136_c0_g1_i1:401-2752(-)